MATSKALALPCVVALWLTSGSVHCSAVSFSAQAQVADSLSYFALQAEAALPKVRALKASIASGSLTAAKEAYIAARSEYEQIEVLAPSFAGIDCAIDCRAYAYTYGEGSPHNSTVAEDEFQGFHRIEAILFRDGILGAVAQKYADGLVALFTQLVTALKTPEAYNYCDWLAGIQGLAYEVGAKKMSSEEKTYSDQSILIFYNNFIGIDRALRPLLPGFRAADAALTDALETAVTAAEASVAPFVHADGTYVLYSQVETAFRAAIQTAAYDLADAIAQASNAYNAVNSVTCGEAPEEEEAACEGNTSADVTAALNQGTDYFLALLAASKPYIASLVSAIEGGRSLDEVQAAYNRARPVYEQLEVLAAAFPDADASLDSRPYGYALGEFSMEFQGFHRLERFVYRDGAASPSDTDPFTGTTLLTWAKQLSATYDSLADQLAAVPATLSPAAVFGSVLGVLMEVPAKKISSEEETWSGLSIMIFHNNWLGARSQVQAFADLADAATRTTAMEAYDRALACLEPYVTASGICNMVTAADVNADCVQSLVTATYTPYSQVPMAARECIVKEGYAVIEATRAVANALDIPNACHSYHHSTAYQYRHSSEPEEVEGAEGVEAEQSAATQTGGADVVLSGGVRTQAGNTLAVMGALYCFAQLLL